VAAGRLPALGVEAPPLPRLPSGKAGRGTAAPGAAAPPGRGVWGRHACMQGLWVAVAAPGLPPHTPTLAPCTPSPAPPSLHQADVRVPGHAPAGQGAGGQEHRQGHLRAEPHGGV
jgi:hypothetical protein